MVDNLTDKSFCYFTNAKSKLINLDCTPPTIKRTIANTELTSNYVNASTPHTSKKIAIDPITVTIPNGNTVTSTHTCELILLSLPKAAQ